MSLASGTKRDAWFQENPRATWPPGRSRTSRCQPREWDEAGRVVPRESEENLASRPAPRPVSHRRPIRCNTPGPGSYETIDPGLLSGKNSPSLRSFAGRMCKVDRVATGYLADRAQGSAGPGSYETSWAVGRQTSSKRPTAATPKFGSSSRDQLLKSTSQDQGMQQLFIHRAAGGQRNCSPSPASYSPIDQNTVPRMGSNKKAPSYTFTKSERQKRHCSSNIGPGSYTSPVSLGKQVSSRRGNAGKTTFGKADRERSKVAVQPEISPAVLKAVQANPGPGTYDTATSSVGKQALGANATAARALFGTAERDELDKLEMRDTHGTPGPGAHDFSSGLGFQANSRFKSSGRTAFTKSTSAPSPILAPCPSSQTAMLQKIKNLGLGRTSPS
jgi:hypothetical protein